MLTPLWTLTELRGIINPDAPYKVVIEGHADEISWYVNYITDDGLYVIRNGGSDHQIAPSKRVNIHTKKRYKGVFDGQLSIPKRRKRRTSKISNLFIDIGCETKEEVIKWRSCRMRDLTQMNS
jgi:putative aminopeptidase FrvX